MLWELLLLLLSSLSVTLKRSAVELTRLFIGDMAPREERLTPGMSRGALLLRFIAHRLSVR